MICNYCGKVLTDGASFCSHCGNAVRPETWTESADLISRAKNGDQQAISILYEQTYNTVFYAVRAMIKDEDAVYDILQDSYLKAFSHLDHFEGSEKFTPWVRRIATNTARDWLKRKRPLLFSELSTGEDTNVPIEELFIDECEEHMPERVLDQAETTRLIREILEELPEDQRAVIGMYYYEGLSIREIAAAMGVTESAVKSRLLYGRRKIAKKVRELEKEGTKLYGLSPIPFLLLLFRGQKAYVAEVPNQAILQNILRDAAAPATTGTGSAVRAGHAVGAHAAKVAGISLSKVVVSVVAAAVVVGGAAFGFTRLSHRAASRSTELPAAQDAVSDMQASALPEESAAPEDPLSEAYEAYRNILAHADSYSFGEYAQPSGEYRYALEDMHTEDSVPTLLLCQLGADYIDHVRIFYYDTGSKTVLAPKKSIITGVAQIGGFRGGMRLMGDGNGLMLSQVAGMRGDLDISRAVRSGEDLIVTLEWSGMLTDSDPYRESSREIIWYDLSDAAGFEDVDRASPDNSSADAAGTMPGGQDALASWIQGEQAAGRTVLTGTVNTYSYDEVVELQGMPDWNPPRYRDYRIIVLDEPQLIKGRSVDGYQESTARLILVDDADIPVGYDGQNITFSIHPDTLWWPSDTRLPVGQPGTKDIHIMK